MFLFLQFLYRNYFSCNFSTLKFLFSPCVMKSRQCKTIIKFALSCNQETYCCEDLQNQNLLLYKIIELSIIILMLNFRPKPQKSLWVKKSDSILSIKSFKSVFLMNRVLLTRLNEQSLFNVSCLNNTNVVNRFILHSAKFNEVNI